VTSAAAYPMTSPIALSDHQLREIQTIALSVPYDLRGLYLQEVATMLRELSQMADLGDGSVHRIARIVANRITWNAGRSATG